MPFTEATLATELRNLVPTDNQAEGAQRFAAAYGDYVKQGSSNGVGVNAAFVDATAAPALATGLAALSGSTDPTTAAGIVTAAIVAFWATAVAAPAGFITGATVVTPPTFATLAATLATVFQGNITNAEPLEAAAANIAAAIHPASLGGTATFPGPVVAPIL